MSDNTLFEYEADVVLEPERYEFDLDPVSEPLAAIGLDRRSFLKLVGGGLVVLCLSRTAEAQQESGAARRRGGAGGQGPRTIDGWLRIADDGAVTVFTGKAEVGQNIRTSLAQAVADELHVPLGTVTLVMADTAKTPFDAGTFGSRSTPTMAPQLRRASAAARKALIELAASQWKVEPASLTAANGCVCEQNSQRSVTFAALARDQALLKTVIDDAPMTPASKWTVAGTSAPKVDGRAFVTGGHKYTSDLKRPGMLRGKVLRAPTSGAKLTSVDTAGVKAIPGVTVVRDGEFVGVVAPDEAAAARALAALKPQWDAPETQGSDRSLFDDLKSTANQGQGAGSPSLKEELAASDAKVEATYTIAYIAHVPLEPRSAVAEWEGDHVTVWTGTQRPFGARDELKLAFGLPDEKVRVIVPDTGSGYGGKHTNQAAVEAARLARAAGKPVKLVWTREEEFTWAYFRPAGVIEVAAGAKKDGTLTGWGFRNINSGGSGLETPYEVSARSVAFSQAKSPLKQGSYRALASTANHFARESVMDELARALGMDPLAFRLKNLKHDRLRAVLTSAAELFGWGKPKSGPDRGVGIAVGTEKGSFVATCAEVAVDPSNGGVKVVRLAAAFDCGAVVNPEHLTNQVQGALVMGLGGALFEAIRFEGGKVLNPRLSRYRVPRFSDLPDIKVTLIDRKDVPSAGAGETPIVAVAPAIGNALCDATGKRVRSMPLLTTRSVMNDA